MVLWVRFWLFGVLVVWCAGWHGSGVLVVCCDLVFGFVAGGFL